MEIHDYWETQQEILNSYGWVDKQNGVVRIPIDQAMRLTLERGLPARAAKPAPPASDMAAGEGSAKSAGDKTE